MSDQNDLVPLNPNHNRYLRYGLIIFAIIYAIAPDFFPGPIDDTIVVAGTYFINQWLKKH